MKHLDCSCYALLQQFLSASTKSWALRKLCDVLLCTACLATQQLNCALGQVGRTVVRQSRTPQAEGATIAKDVPHSLRTASLTVYTSLHICSYIVFSCHASPHLFRIKWKNKIEINNLSIAMTSQMTLKTQNSKHQHVSIW